MMDCFYHEGSGGSTTCGICRKPLCEACVNPNDGFCWSCSHDVQAGIYASKGEHARSLQRMKQYAICFLVYEISFCLLYTMFSRTMSPVIILFETPFVLFVGIPVSALLEWIMERLQLSWGGVWSASIGLFSYFAAGLLLSLAFFGTSEIMVFLTVSASLSLFFILRMLRSRKRPVFMAALSGYAALMLLNILYLPSLDY